MLLECYRYRPRWLTSIALGLAIGSLIISLLSIRAQHYERRLRIAELNADYYAQQAMYDQYKSIHKRLVGIIVHQNNILMSTLGGD